MQELLQQLVNGLTLGSTYAVVALGFGLIFSVMNVVNLAHPQTVMIGSYAAYLSIATAHLPIPVALLIGIVAAALAGMTIERTVIRTTRGSGILTPFIATAGVSIALEAGAQRVFGVDPLPIASPLTGLRNIAGAIITDNQILTVGAALIVMVLLSGYVRRTKWGRATRAVAENHEVASALGIDVNAVSRLTVAVSAAMGGIAGVCIGLLLGQASPFIGQTFGLKSFICMLVAGNRYPEGIMVVGLLLGLLEALVTGYVSDSLRDVVTLGILVAVLYFRPAGLFGSYEHR